MLDLLVKVGCLVDSRVATLCLCTSGQHGLLIKPNTQTMLPSSEPAQSNGDGASTLALLQRFLIIQQTRAGISNELAIAFRESGITDAALARVVEISSVGLLEVKEEAQAIIESLPRDSHDRKCCEKVEELEKQRVLHDARSHQYSRVLYLLQSSTSPPADKQQELHDSLSQEQTKVRELVDDINDNIDEIRASVAELAVADD